MVYNGGLLAENKTFTAHHIERCQVTNSKPNLILGQFFHFFHKAVTKKFFNVKF